MEAEKSEVDRECLQSIIDPRQIMFDPLQKANLISFFTNKDIFLIKLIPMLSVYLEQTKQCQELY